MTLAEAGLHRLTENGWLKESDDPGCSCTNLDGVHVTKLFTVAEDGREVPAVEHVVYTSTQGSVPVLAGGRTLLVMDDD